MSERRPTKRKSKTPTTKAATSKSAITKVFQSGGSQAVRIPKEFRLPGEEVRIRQLEDGNLLLEPVKPKVSWEEWLANLEEARRKYGPLDIVIDEPELPADEISFD